MDRKEPGVGRLVRFDGPRSVSLVEYSERMLGPRDVRLRTRYSGISAGTELTAYRGSNPYLSKRWEDERRLFLSGDVSTLEYPVDGWGYEEVGEVIEVGTSVGTLHGGEVVWGAWGHRSTNVVGEDWAADRVLSPDADPMTGVFSQIGAIALNAVLDADIHVGEVVAVFGQGVPGLIAGQLARLNGATVIAVDGIAGRLELAGALGAAHLVDVTRERAAERIKWITDGRGADVCIEFTGSYAALNEAIRATAYNSRVVASGFFQGEGVGLLLGEEFHHNRIQVVCSQISGVSPHLDHRWNELRLQRTVMELATEGKLDLRPLVSHVIPVAQAEQAFRILDQRPEEAIQVVLDFSGDPATSENAT
jgi:threonine dehydrogenase-like Zn-dependent dehydrogenase